MNREQLEFSISRYLDGTLPATERLSLDIRLNQDSEARNLLAEYRAFASTLDDAKAALPQMPEINWDVFASRISSSIDQAREAGDVEQPAVIGRIGFGVRRWMAVAASVMIAAGIGFVALRNRTVTTLTVPGTGTNIAVANAAIEINLVNDASGDVSAQTSPVVVAIGPSTDSSGEPAIWRYADDVVSRSPAIVIASGNRPAQDSYGFPN